LPFTKTYIARKSVLGGKKKVDAVFEKEPLKMNTKVKKEREKKR